MRAIVRSQDERGVAPVIAEILLVAITVSIAGVLYLYANSISSQSVSTSPYVVLSPAKLENGVAVITVSGASRDVPASSYRANLQVGSAFGKPVGLAASGQRATVAVSGVSYAITWTDVGNAGVLVQGDPITVAAVNGPLPAGTAFGFYLIWSDGSVVQSVAWTT